MEAKHSEANLILVWHKNSHCYGFFLLLLLVIRSILVTLDSRLLIFCIIIMVCGNNCHKYPYLEKRLQVCVCYWRFLLFWSQILFFCFLIGSFKLKEFFFFFAIFGGFNFLYYCIRIYFVHKYSFLKLSPNFLFFYHSWCPIFGHIWLLFYRLLLKSQKKMFLGFSRIINDFSVSIQNF